MTDVIDIKTRRLIAPPIRNTDDSSGEPPGVERLVYELEEDTDRSIAIAPDGGMVVVLLNTDPVRDDGSPAALVMDPETATELGVGLIESAHTARRLAAALQAPKSPKKG